MPSRVELASKKKDVWYSMVVVSSVRQERERIGESGLEIRCAWIARFGIVQRPVAATTQFMSASFDYGAP